MIKKFKLYILLVAVAFSTVSCLDKMPDDSIPFDESIRTVDDVNLAVIGIYDHSKVVPYTLEILRCCLIYRLILCMG